jgi:hypothetical protein
MPENVAVADCLLLLLVEAVFFHIGLLVGLERLAVLGLVERVAHLVQGVAFHGLLAIEDGRARDVDVIVKTWLIHRLLLGNYGQ